jgi:hypothetical protein
MKRRFDIALIAVLALTLHGVGFCGGAIPWSYQTLAHPAQEQNGSCPLHSEVPGSRASHECCHFAACLNDAKFVVDKDGRAPGSVPMLLPVVLILRSIEPAEFATRFAACAAVHAPPFSRPIFLSLRTLLI